MIFLGKLGRFIKAYQATLAVTVFVLIAILYPNIAIRFNPIPASSEMREARGTIQLAHKDYPHLRLLLDNGNTIDFMFPGNLQGVYFAEWERFFPRKREDFKLMKGCQATVKYDELRHIFVSAPPRMWSVDCDRASISFDEIKMEFEKSNEFHGLFTSAKGWLFVITFLLIVLALIVEIYVERTKSK